MISRVPKERVSLGVPDVKPASFHFRNSPGVSLAPLAEALLEPA